MLIIFWDYDGTLVDTEKIYRDSLISFFKSNNYLLKDLSDKYFYANIAGKHPEDFLKKLEEDKIIKPNLEIDPAEIKKYYTKYFRDLAEGEVKVMGEMDLLVEKLSKFNDIIMCITSSTYAHDFEIKNLNVKNHIFNKNFNIDENIYLCGAIENCKFKPEPDVFIYAFNDIVKKYNLNPTREDNLIIVEDSIAGCRAGKKFKEVVDGKIDVKILAYSQDSIHDNSRELLANGADYIIKNGGSLMDIIMKIKEDII